MASDDDVTIRIYYRQPGGEVEDAQEDFGLETFAGILPTIGDTIVNPGASAGIDRGDPLNRQVWTVVQRVFHPRDLPNYVVLVVEVRQGAEADVWI